MSVPESFLHAAILLALSVPDEVVESLRPAWGNTNVSVIRYWRDLVLAADRAK